MKVTRQDMRSGRGLLAALGSTFLFWGAAALAQSNIVLAEAEEKQPPKIESWNLHAQTTVVPQGHTAFNSPYFSPQSSLLPNGEFNTSVTATVFAGARAWKGGELYLNPEMGAGSGISNSHGIAAFTNGEIYRVGDDTAPKLYLSRLYLKQTFGFGGETERIEGGPNQLASEQDVSRISVTLGKFSLNDMFDNNAYSHDPRTQFLNWALMDNGAWDYAADTRGYTWGFVVELNQKDWAVRLGSVLEPKVANQVELDTDIGQAHGDNLELEYRYRLFAHPGKVRALGYLNHAHMGNYRQSIALGAAAGTTPDITQTGTYSTKYGFGLGFEQELTEDLGAFARLGWDDGATETWAFTEIDRAVSVGLSLKGRWWGRDQDTLGGAYLFNDLSGAHADYLRAGGKGFMVGDGRVSFAPEQVIEVYYSLKIHQAFSISSDLQEVFNPGYNRDRGPVTVVSGRLHAEI